MFITVERNEDGVRMIDQRVLPAREEYLVLRTPEEVADAIRDMVVRGAPAIGISAAYGLALGATGAVDLDPAFLTAVCELTRAAGALSQRRHGALVVLERESNLGDLIEAGVPVAARITKELLASIFQPTSPMHDGAVVIQEGRVSSAGCILPLTLRTDLPEGLGTRHRAAVGITEETDALVVVVSEETAKISVVLGGEMLQGLDAPQLRVVLRDILGGERKTLPAEADVSGRLEVAEEAGHATAS